MEEMGCGEAATGRPYRRLVILRNSLYNKCTPGISLCLILGDDFLSAVYKFTRRTRRVRRFNLGAAGGTSASKAGAGDLLSVHILYKEDTS